MTHSKEARKIWLLCAAMLILFLAVLFSVKTLDVQPIGPEGSSIGLATVNAGVRDLFGVNMLWYELTDWLGIVSILVALGFALLALCQLIRRKSLWKVDRNLLVLGALYAAVMAVYVLFELLVINRRPILMEGELEASFPSSHTMLVICIMGSAIHQWTVRIKNRRLMSTAVLLSAAIIAVTVIGRMICGVHWFTDILAGVLISGALLAAYCAVCKSMKTDPLQ